MQPNRISQIWQYTYKYGTKRLFLVVNSTTNSQKTVIHLCLHLDETNGHRFTWLEYEDFVWEKTVGFKRIA